MNTQNKKKDNRGEHGQVIMFSTLLILTGSMFLVGAIIALVKSQIRTMTELSFSKSAYIFTEGALEDVVYRHKNAMKVDATETLSSDLVSVTTVTTATFEGKDVVSTGTDTNRTRKIKAILIEGEGASFSFGIQTSNGGLVLENNSSIEGNVYSNGSIIGAGLNLVNGTAISAGPTGYIHEIHAADHAYSHTIEDSYIEGNAYYTSIDIATVVDGIKVPGFPDLSTSTLPIPEALVDSWELYAETADILTDECAAAGGHIVYDADVTLGPVKIPCDVTFEKDPVVTIAGIIWVEGNLDFTQGPQFKIDPDIGNKSVPIIVDNPADRLTSSEILIRNSGTWTGNGDRSYIMLLSRNNSVEMGGSESAITIENSSGGSLLVYAGHGEILLQNNTDLTEITAYRVRLQNNTQVVYDSGLASAVFVAGPGGGYVVDSWKEVE